jgi:hypothetical protein
MVSTPVIFIYTQKLSTRLTGLLSSLHQENNFAVDHILSGDLHAVPNLLRIELRELLPATSLWYIRSRASKLYIKEIHLLIFRIELQRAKHFVQREHIYKDRNLCPMDIVPDWSIDHILPHHSSSFRAESRYSR